MVTDVTVIHSSDTDTSLVVFDVGKDPIVISDSTISISDDSFEKIPKVFYSFHIY